MNSFLIDVGDRKRNGTELREFLSRWVGPAIVYPQLAATIGPLIALENN